LNGLDGSKRSCEIRFVQLSPRGALFAKHNSTGQVPSCQEFLEKLEAEREPFNSFALLYRLD